MIISIVFICFYYGKNIKYDDQQKLFDALRNTSSTIFAIMGIWIAVIYPNILTKVSSSNHHNQEDIAKIKSLIYPMIYSLFIFSSVLIFQFLAPVIKQISFFQYHYKIIRASSYAFLSILTLLQLWTVLLAILPGEYLLRDLAFSSSTEEALKKKRSRQKNQ